MYNDVITEWQKLIMLDMFVDGSQSLALIIFQACNGENGIVSNVRLELFSWFLGLEIIFEEKLNSSCILITRFLSQFTYVLTKFEAEINNLDKSQQSSF